MARELDAAQVSLLVRLLPYIAPEEVFALKGGTAINLFYRDMQPLSVDIDLTYLPVRDRAESLAGQAQGAQGRARKDLHLRESRKIGLDVALEALRDAWRTKRFAMDDLWHFAGICRVPTVMRPGRGHPCPRLEESSRP